MLTYLIYTSHISIDFYFRCSLFYLNSILNHTFNMLYGILELWYSPFLIEIFHYYASVQIRNRLKIHYFSFVFDKANILINKAIFQILACTLGLQNCINLFASGSVFLTLCFFTFKYSTHLPLILSCFKITFILPWLLVLLLL